MAAPDPHSGPGDTALRGGRPGGGGGSRPDGGGVTEARQAAADICADLRSGELLDSAFELRTARLDARDRRWTRELVYGMLRRRSQLDAVLAERVSGGFARLDADLQDLLRLGTHQLLHMGSVPPYAAIAQTVELAKRRHGIGASKLANAVLRRVDRERDALQLAVPTDAVDALALQYSHPRWLVSRWITRWGIEDTQRLLSANNGEGPLIARPIHVVREQLEAMLEGAGVHVTDAPLVRDSVLLAGGLSSLAELGAFRKGLFHLQDPASTLVTMFAAIPAGATVADLCAAPGGKSVELSRHAGLVASSDISLHRLQRVAENVERMDLGERIAPYVADARHPAIRPVDVVLLDAPCTGTGTFRRHPDARWRLRPTDVTVMSALQRELLRSAATVVAPGGLLVYSTCSIEREENEAQVEAFLRDHPGWTEEAPPAGAVPAAVVDGASLRVLPQLHGTDGSFAARLRRPT
jgi:16S rRNA (cytosine967-C5)-methyltransferase